MKAEFKVDCYVEQTTRAFRKMDRGIGFVLECMVHDVPMTRNGFSTVKATAHAAELTAITAALERMTKPSNITIHTEDLYVLKYLDMIDEVAAGGFRKADGSPLNNRDLWVKVYDLSKPHKITAAAGSHEYSGWIRSELSRRGLGNKEKEDGRSVS